MTDSQASSRRAGRPIGGELIIPVAAILFTLYYFWTIRDSPWTAQVSAFFVGAILLALCLVFIGRRLYQARKGTAHFGIGDLVSRADITSGRLAVFAFAILYIYLIQWGGFTLTTFAFLALSMAVLNKGRRLGLIALVSLAMVLGGYLLFIVAFDTRFPHGPFEVLMERMF